MNKTYLGVDIGGTAVKLGLVDETGIVLRRAERSVSFDGYKTPILDTVQAAIRDFMSSHDAPRLEGIGVSATGQIDSRRGVVAGTCGNFPGWIGVDIKGTLEREFGLPVMVANDANCMLLGEVWAGAAKGYTDVIGVTLGTGVGGGILTGGRLLEGARGLGGELGHFRLHALDGVPCTCGAIGCYASYRSYLNKHFCVLGKILLKKLEPHTLQEFYNYKFREEGLSPKTLRNYHMALHKCLQQAVKERLLVYNPCDAVTLPSGEKPEIVVFSNDQQCALVQASYRHRYGVFIRLDLCTGLRMGELLALKWEDIDFSTAQLHVRRTINRLAKYEAHNGENKTEIVFGTPKTKNSRRTIPLTRTMADELTRWKQQQAQDKIRAGDKYTDDGFIVTNEFGHYFEQKTFKDYYDRLLKDADIGHFTFHALRHTFATRALERGMDYKTLSAILGHYSVAFTMDTYVHSMDEHKRREMDKMNDIFGMRYSISVENQPYPVLCTLSADGCTAHVPDFPKVTAQAPTLDAALLEVKQQIQKALRQYKNPPIPTKQDQIVVPTNSVLVLVKAS